MSRYFRSRVFLTRIKSRKSLVMCSSSMSSKITTTPILRPNTFFWYWDNQSLLRSGNSSFKSECLLTTISSQVMLLSESKNTVCDLEPNMSIPKAMSFSFSLWSTSIATLASDSTFAQKNNWFVGLVDIEIPLSAAPKCNECCNISAQWNRACKRQYNKQSKWAKPSESLKTVYCREIPVGCKFKKGFIKLSYSTSFLTIFYRSYIILKAKLV